MFSKTSVLIALLLVAFVSIAYSSPVAHAESEASQGTTASSSGTTTTVATTTKSAFGMPIIATVATTLIAYSLQ